VVKKALETPDLAVLGRKVTIMWARVLKGKMGVKRRRKGGVGT
jgi:hypothetical protein